MIFLNKINFYWSLIIFYTFRWWWWRGCRWRLRQTVSKYAFIKYKTKRKQNYVCFTCSITCRPNLFINEEIILKLTLLPKNLVQFLSFNFLVLLVHFINLLKLKTENQKKKDQNTNENIFKPIHPLVQNKVRNDKKKSTKEQKGEIYQPLPIYPIKILRRLETYIFFLWPLTFIHIQHSWRSVDCMGKMGPLRMCRRWRIAHAQTHVRQPGSTIWRKELRRIGCGDWYNMFALCRVSV